MLATGAAGSFEGSGAFNQYGDANFQGTHTQFNGTSTEWINSASASFGSGSIASWLSGSTAEWRNGSFLNVLTGALVQVQGTVHGNNGSSWEWATGSTSQWDSGSHFTISDGTVVLVTVSSGGAVRIKSGAALTLDDGSTFTDGSVHTKIGAGHDNCRVTYGTDADGTYSVNNCDKIIVDTSVHTLTAPHNYTISSTGAQLGSQMRVYNGSNEAVTLVQDSGSTIDGIVLCWTPTGTQYTWVDLVHNGTPNGWRICGGAARPH
jgi:hypothetical protein